MELKQIQSQEPIKRKMDKELYNELMDTVINNHIKNIYAELYELYNDVANKADLTQGQLNRLSTVTRTAPAEIKEQLKNCFW